jgi:ParB family chromosome partitioning protein
VAAEAAAAADPPPSAARVEAARDRTDAETLRAARAAGRLIAEIPISEIAVDELTRDRMGLDREELDELKKSIRASGLRLPVEVFELAAPEAGARYGLIPGPRRVTAVRELYGPDARIAALVRGPRDAADAIAAMVEENEIRASLSHYERGRIAAPSVGQGRFSDLEEAVARLFGSASKAKRSKIRSFALVHEELGDMLGFPRALTEKGGLRLANALRLGFEERLREALAAEQGVDAGSEWETLLAVIEQAETSTQPTGRGGRPRKAGQVSRPARHDEGYRLANGATMTHERDGRDHVIRFRGEAVDGELVERVVEEIYRLLKPAG